MKLPSRRSPVFALSCLFACRCTHPGTEPPPAVVVAPPVMVVDVTPQVVAVQAVVPVVPVVQVATQPPRSGAPTLQCPAPVAVPAGRSVTLNALGTGAGPLHYRWTVPTAPSASAFRFAPRYDRADSDSIVAEGASVPFISVVVGTLLVHAEVRDGEGQTAACDVPVTVQPHGLRVELSWDTDSTDVDLHMLSGPSGQWFSQTDCYYANRTPDTAMEVTGAQRGLDRDDVDGYGPENIRVDEPVADTDYTVGVNYYSSHGQHGPTLATVVVYCGNEQVARMRHPIEGDRNGPYQNDFWTVGVARVDSAGRCGFRPVNHLGTASPAGT